MKENFTYILQNSKEGLRNIRVKFINHTIKFKLANIDDLYITMVFQC